MTIHPRLKLYAIIILIGAFVNIDNLIMYVYCVEILINLSGRSRESLKS